eukprot:TRINITY_DN2269_c0_g1_i16.p1 TRINITY_DN2269_c0_g1~~TRINITY_DN2269_c0_g1_i16.p1  ORF type:complete len:567 (-),score=143.54 TRINITY_DN2269_c0_g1_i16:54-1754(-)
MEIALLKFFQPFVNVCRWFDTVMNQPLVKAVVGPTLHNRGRGIQNLHVFDTESNIPVEFVPARYLETPPSSEKPQKKELAQEHPEPNRNENIPERPSERPSEFQSENRTENPSENQVEKPSENQTEKPAENQTGKPSENQTEKPAENQAEKPAENQAEKPVENQTEKHSENQPSESGNLTKITVSDTSRGNRRLGSVSEDTLNRVPQSMKKSSSQVTKTNVIKSSSRSKLLAHKLLKSATVDSSSPVATSLTLSSTSSMTTSTITTEEEIHKLKRLEKLFQKSDLDGNGTLDSNEIQILLVSAFQHKAGSYTPSLYEEALVKFSDKQFASFCVPGEDYVDFDGFVQLYDAVLNAPDIPQDLKSCATSAEEEYKKSKREKKERKSKPIFSGISKKEVKPDLSAQQKEDYMKSFGDLFGMEGITPSSVASGSDACAGTTRLGLQPNFMDRVPKAGHPPPIVKSLAPKELVSLNSFEGGAKVTFTVKAGGPSGGWGKILKGGKEVWINLEAKTNISFTPQHVEDLCKLISGYKPNSGQMKKNLIYLELQAPEDVERICSEKVLTYWVKT